MAKEGTMTLVALFDPSVSIEQIRAQLLQAGVPEAAVEVRSSIPLMETPRRSGVPLHLLSILGGLVGIGVGLFLTVGTALFYPLMTGGKPLVAYPVVGIISFETMMLLAIVTTFAAAVFRIRSAQQPSAWHPPGIDDGMVGISVLLDAEMPRASEIRGLLERTGATEVRTL